MNDLMETPEDFGTDEESFVRRWLREIEVASEHESEWRERAEKVIERYRDERDEAVDPAVRFNMLYANVEVLRGVVYQNPPTPDCRRRFLDDDPVGQYASQVLERALSYHVDAEYMDELLADSVQDQLLPGRAQVYVQYKPTISTTEVVDPETGETEEVENVDFEEVVPKYISWEWFRMSPAPRWEKVRWVAFGELLTREDLVSQFGEELGKRIKLHWTPSDVDPEDDDSHLYKRALVWTIWDKTKREVIILTEGLKDRPIKRQDDPLGLEGFFPCPKPLSSVSTNNTMIPVSEYVQYQDQADELDTITERINALTDALRYRGVYDNSMEELQRLATADDNTFIPVENYANLVEKGGIERAFMAVPIKEISQTLIGLYQQRDQIKSTIYEITGISDILRGDSNALETATAQNIKAQYGNSRIAPRQKGVQNFARDILRIMAEIIAEHFSIETLQQMTGIQLPREEDKRLARFQIQQLQQVQQMQAQGGGQPDPQQMQQLRETLQTPSWEQVMELLRNDKLRGFKVDVETDSTIRADADTEKQQRVEFITSVTSYLEKITPLVQTGAVPQDLAKQLLLFGTRAFSVGGQMEDALESLGQGQQGGQSAEQQQEQQAELQQKEAELQEQQAEIEKKVAQWEVDRAKAEAQQTKAEADLIRKQAQLELQQAQFARNQAQQTSEAE